MKNTLKKSLVFLCLFSFCMLFVKNVAAADYVAKIGETSYEELNEAIKAASSTETTTIEILQDCTLGLIQNKDIHFIGNGTISVSNYTFNNGFSKTWEFDGENLAFEWTNGKDNWLMWALSSGTLRVNNGARVTFKFDSNATRSNCALYVTSKSVIEVLNGSTFEIYGKTDVTTVGQGIQSDAANGTKIIVTGGSTFLIDGTNRGYVCSPNVYVEDSTFTVRNTTSNASNGGIFKAVNSEVNFLNNGGHGLSADTLTSINSTFNCNGNAYYGITVNTAGIGDMDYTLYVDKTSVINANENGRGYTGGGLRLSKADATGLVEAGAKVTIDGNQKNGLENGGNLTFENGTIVEIKDNYNKADNGGGIFNKGTLYISDNTVITNNTAEQTGGGICNAGTITFGENVSLYNNHAKTAGDDIYNRDGGIIALFSVGEDWHLDGIDAASQIEHCTDLINGWYDDAADARWEAHQDDLEANHIVKIAAGEITGLNAIKAAHPLTGSVVVYYVDVDNNPLYNEDVILSGYTDDTYETEQKTFDGYTFVEVTGQTEGNYPVVEEVVTYVYTKTPAKVIVHYVDVEGTPLTDDVTIDGFVNEEYSTEAKTFEGYKFVKNEGYVSGNFAERTIEVTYIYDKIPAKVIAHYVDTEGTPLLTDITLDGFVAENYNTEKKTIDGYTFVEVKGVESGKYTEETIEVTYVYTKTPAKVIAHYVDTKGETLSEDITLDGFVNEEYITEQLTIDGYTFVEVKGEVTGKYTVETIEVTYVYTKTPAKVIVHYVDVEGKTLTDDITLDGFVTEKYTTEQKTFEDYEFIEVKGDKTGAFTEETIEVTYVYEFVGGEGEVEIPAKVIVHYIDQDGNKLSGDETIDGIIGGEYVTDEKAFDGYTLVKVEGNQTGNFEEELIEVTYIYSKNPIINTGVESSLNGLSIVLANISLIITAVLCVLKKKFN